MAQSFANIILHIIFSTKNRLRLIPKTVQPDVSAYIAGVFKQKGSQVIIVRAMEEHVHALVRVSKSMAISDLIGKVKSGSSKWAKTRCPCGRLFRWQNGYGAFSVSASQVKVVRRYIENQEAHHRRMTFEEEYLKLLKKHGVEYDERYLWN